MDDNIKIGLRNWIESLKTEYKDKEEIVEKKRVELEVLKVRKEIAEESIHKVSDGASLENFKNKFIQGVDDEFKKVSDELITMRAERKELNIHLTALESTILGSSFREHFN